MSLRTSARFPPRNHSGNFLTLVTSISNASTPHQQAIAARVGGDEPNLELRASVLGFGVLFGGVGFGVDGAGVVQLGDLFGDFRGGCGVV
jgi:hypothetical protein